MLEIAAVWNSVFHKPEPMLALGVFRLVFGLLLLLYFLILLPDAGFLYGNVAAQIQGKPARGQNRDRRIRWIFVLAIVGSAGLAAGLATPLSAALLFFCFTVLYRSNPAIKYGADGVMRMMTLLLIFAPLGLPLSLDRLILERHGLTVSNVADPWVLRLMQIQVATIYWKSALAKFQSPDWRGGLATYFSSSSVTFKRWSLPSWLVRPGFYRLTSWSVTWVEALFAPLVWVSATRYWVLGAVAGLHLGIEYLMNVQLYGWVMLSSLTLFL